VAAGGRILVAYLVFFFAIGAAFPYLPVFYRDLGLGLEQIGLLAAIQAAISLVLAPVWGGLTDRFPRSRLTLPAAGVVATIGAGGLFVATDFNQVLVGSLVLYAGLAGIGAPLDARTLELLGPERRARYGQVRAFGSLAFVVSAVAVGFLLDATDPRALFWVYLPCLVGTIVVTASIPRVGHIRSMNLWRGARDFVEAPGIALFFVGIIVVWTSLAATSAFYSIQVVALGGTASLVGLAWAVGALVEVPIMYAFPRIGARAGTERLVVLGCVGFALRAGLAALAGSPVALVAIAPIEGLAFAGVFVGGVTVLAARAPVGLGGTAQGLFSASAGLATIIGATGGGAIAGALGIPGLFAISALVALIGAALVGVALLGVPPGWRRAAARS
jgi:PPP family 3-phenylpropionic acid transporter